MPCGVENALQVANNRNIEMCDFPFIHGHVGPSFGYVWCRIDAVYILAFSFGLLCMPSHSTAQVPSIFCFVIYT